jgi:hypothetical protein
MRYQITLAAILTLLAVSNLPAQVGTNLVYNGEFDTPGSNGLDTSHEGQSPNLMPGSASAADGWNIWHNTDGVTATTSLTYDEAGIASIDSSQDRLTDRLLRVEASGIGNGLVQVLSPPGTGPAAAEGSIWLYVTGPGQSVGVGIGDGGSTPILETNMFTGRWEEIQFSQSNMLVNEIVIYAQTSGAEFYVDRVSVSAVPEPSGAIALLLSGLATVTIRRRR